MSNPIYEMVKSMKGWLGTRVPVMMNDTVWVYPNSFGGVVLFIEPNQAGLNRGTDPLNVTLTDEQVGEIIAALERETRASKALREEKQRG